MGFDLVVGFFCVCVFLFCSLRLGRTSRHLLSKKQPLLKTGHKLSVSTQLSLKWCVFLSSSFFILFSRGTYSKLFLSTTVVVLNLNLHLGLLSS